MPITTEVEDDIPEHKLSTEEETTVLKVSIPFNLKTIESYYMN